MGVFYQPGLLWVNTVKPHASPQAKPTNYCSNPVVAVLVLREVATVLVSSNFLHTPAEQSKPVEQTCINHILYLHADTF